MTQPTPLPQERKHSIEELARLVRTDDVSEPIRIVDVFCGAGGVGWALKDIFGAPGTRGTFTGVDIVDHSDTYPGKFVQINAEDLTLDTLGLDEPVDLVWLSPPCQAYSKLSRIWYDDPKAVHPTFEDLGVRRIANNLGKEYVIENVVGCDDLRNPIKLNGPAFGKPLVFERWFETSFNVNSWRADANGDEMRFCEVSESDQAKAKSVPAEWSKADIRSALPRVYVGYLISHCPTLSDVHPENIKDDYRRCGAGDGQRWLSEYT